ncbi:unnamed protein product [Phytophthora lilii]|uniref:Unnamed protein product n=1 Tax=Phytophthora lilii TaxID=2077276 RepID=A0A9W6TDY0_9STRA|nr:unnamed protein product [Phytophthora lilii]
MLTRLLFQSVAAEMDRDSSMNWTTRYYEQERLHRENKGWRNVLHPSVIGASLAIVGRPGVGPVMLLLLFIFTNYLSSEANFLITSDNSFFAFTEHDLSMAGGCVDCRGTCKIVLLKYALFGGEALTSAPTFAVFAGQPPMESLYDFSVLSSDALVLGESLDAGSAICESGVNDWGSAISVVTASPELIRDVIATMNLSIPSQMMQELEVSITRIDECPTTWSIMAIPRQFLFPAVHESPEFGKISAVAINIFPEYTECRPDTSVADEIADSKLALSTYGRDLLAVVPDALRLFPYSFKSSMHPVSRVVKATEIRYEAETVVEPLQQAYYGGCRVCEVNATGIYIEATCDTSQHWEIYGLMVQSPDDIPLCSTSGTCIHNYYNTQWEWVTEFTDAKPNGVAMYCNTFRSRYADNVAISILPGLVVMQIFIMGNLSLYQVMSHKRSVLLTQIWAYRCQNGRMQVLYLAQIAYHLFYNSDLYLLGLATGTLTTVSIANLTCSLYAFSYSFINLAKARSGDQRLDRHFRLTWETMQVVITGCVVATLRVVQRNPLESIISTIAQILRKTSPLGARYCGLNDACIVFTVNSPTIVTLMAAVLGLVAMTVSELVKKMTPKVRKVIPSARASISLLGSFTGINPTPYAGTTQHLKTIFFRSRQTAPFENHVTPDLTSFEKNCLGSSFKKLFYDCDDIAYVMYNGKRCSTVEALLLTGYLYYGEHIYQASAVQILVLARFLPRKLLRTFNVLILRWYLNPETGTLTHALSCTWYAASRENHALNGTTPVA